MGRPPVSKRYCSKFCSQVLHHFDPPQKFHTTWFSHSRHHRFPSPLCEVLRQELQIDKHGVHIVNEALTKISIFFTNLKCQHRTIHDVDGHFVECARKSKLYHLHGDYRQRVSAMKMLYVNHVCIKRSTQYNWTKMQVCEVVVEPVEFFFMLLLPLNWTLLLQHAYSAGDN